MFDYLPLLELSVLGTLLILQLVYLIIKALDKKKMIDIISLT